MGSPVPDSGDLYERLGIPRSASRDEIKRAYLALVREYTPERSPEVFKRIREAYETLNNPESRKQYDSRPDPRIQALLNQASEAMKVQDYRTAEQAYKQVLLASPGFHWVRNQLGLCFLYQKRPDQAILQCERLLREGYVDQAVHRNLADAYRLARRFDEAERQYRVAMRLAGGQGFEHGLALIQMIADRGDVEAADRVALTQFEAASRGSPAAAEYGARRIGLALQLGRRVTIPSLLDRMSQGLTGDHHRWFVAFAMRKTAGWLISQEQFQIAEQVAKAAKALWPTDQRNDALEHVSHLLYLNDFDGVARLLNIHVSFASTGPLHHLKPLIEGYCATHAVFKGMQPLSSPPSAFGFWGIGMIIAGHRDDDPQTGTYVVTQYFRVSFIPLFPVALYRVRPAPDGNVSYLGRIPLGRREKIHIRVSVVALFVLWILLVVSGQRPSPASPSPPAPPASGVKPATGQSATRFAAYTGEVVNTTRPVGPIRARFRLTLKDWQASPNGYLTVDPPLTGSSPCFLQARGDSVRFATITARGDTTLWYALRQGDSLVGNFRVIGGQLTGQHGTWHALRTGGGPIPDRVNPW